jgi:hypothetical protein
MYDVGDAFWQLPVSDELGELTTFAAVDEDGNPQMYAMRRAAQGSINGSADFSIALQNVLAPMLGKCALVYIDDVLLFARDAESLVDANAQFHSLIATANVKVRLSKAELYTEEAHWLGLVLTKDGVRQDGSRIQGLVSVQRPVTADLLSSWLGSLGWMRNHLPDFARVVEPLQELKNEASKLVGSLRSSDLKKVNLKDTGMWKPVHDAAWDATVG